MRGGRNTHTLKKEGRAARKREGGAQGNLTHRGKGRGPIKKHHTNEPLRKNFWQGRRENLEEKGEPFLERVL